RSGYGRESPSRWAGWLAPRFPFTQSLASMSQPSLLGDGACPFAHWSRLADGFAPVAAAGRNARSAAVTRSVSSQRPRLKARLLACSPDLSRPRGNVNRRPAVRKLFTCFLPLP